MEKIQIYVNKEEEKLLDFLNDLYDKIQTSEVKSIDWFIKQYNLPSRISPVLFIDVITKTRPYKWKAKKPDIELARDILQDADTYTSFYEKVPVLKKLYQEENEFKFDLKKLWKGLGYNQYFNAIRTLLDSCEENKDFIRLINEEKRSILNKNEDEKEFFLLSEVGLKMFLSFSQKPMAKYILREICRIEQNSKKIFQMVFNGARNLVVEAKVLDDVEEASQLTRILKVNLANKFHDKVTTGSFVLNFDIDLLEDVLKKHIEEYSNTVLKSITNKNDVVLQLPERSKTISLPEETC